LTGANEGTTIKNYKHTITLLPHSEAQQRFADNHKRWRLINLVVFQLFTHIIGEEEDEVTKNDQI
jgi:triosephosphate isomerase